MANHGWLKLTPVSFSRTLLKLNRYKETLDLSMEVAKKAIKEIVVREKFF